MYQSISKMTDSYALIFVKENSKMYELVFSGLRDSVLIKKFCLHIIQILLEKKKQHNQFSLIDKHLRKNKLLIL